MPSSKPRFTYRTDETTLKKLDIIAENEKRSLNQQLDKIVCDFITTYENMNGEIIIEQG